jgi:hypothetical protein
MLYWIDCKIGVDASNEAEARLKAYRSIIGEEIEFNYLISMNVSKDKKFKTLDDLRKAQKEKK